MSEQLSPATLRDWERAFALRGFIYDHADAWEADIDRAEEAERIWFQEGYAQAEQRLEAAEAALAQLADCINQELRESGGFDTQVEDPFSDMRPAVRRLVDLARRGGPTR